MVIGLAVILAALIGAAAGGVAAIWFTNRDWRRRLAEFEECQTFLNEGRAYTLYRMPTREEKPRAFAVPPKPAERPDEATAPHEERGQ
jgi:hypothetical protein